MKSITYLGQTFFLLIAFSLLFTHNEYWDLPLLLGLFFVLANSTLAYPYPILPILALCILLYSIVTFGKQKSNIWKYIINIGAYFLLTGSIYLMMYLEGGANKNLFNGFLPTTTLILFCIVSACFLITNFSGLIKLFRKTPASLH
jgi:hypothetical protein